VINFVAVSPAGAGDLRYTPFGTPVPLASFLNYVSSGIPNDNTANGMTFPICNPATTGCTSDFTIQADVSATNVVADVQGYFRALPPAGRAWASVQRALGVVQFEAARTKNFTAVTRPLTGVYCVTPATGLTLANVPIMVTIEWSNSLGSDLLVYPVGIPAAPCTGAQLQVRTFRLPGGVATPSDDVAFFLWVP
jgi:hypothetical protein